MNDAPKTGVGYGFNGFLIALCVFTVICWVAFFMVETIQQEMVALLAGIGSCVFWGTLMIVAAHSLAIVAGTGIERIIQKVGIPNEVLKKGVGSY